MGKMIAVAGPTASGKSDLAVELAKHFNAEIISCDSMQIYKGMNIGTAKPTIEQMQGIPHHLVDFVDAGREYSVSDYVTDAARVVTDIQSRGKLPVFCGGTGLYLTSFLSGIEFSEFENDMVVHDKVQKLLDEKGKEALYFRLCEVDPVSAENIDMNNVKRVLRAVEVYETTGIAASEWNRRSKEKAVKKDCLVIGLDFSDREKLYERIDKRVDIMLDMGLEAEARRLYECGVLDTKTASQAIAYKEFLPYFKGEASLEECVEILKRNSRRYAKRQLTWFRRESDVRWIYKDGKTDEEIFEQARSLVQEYLKEGSCE